MSEQNTRHLLFLSSGLSIFTAIVAIFLGVRGSQGLAAVFLLFAIAGAVMAGVIYKRYTALRNARWHRELAENEHRMQQALADGGSQTIDDR